MTTDIVLLKENLNIDPAIFKNGTLYQIENSIKALDKIHLLALAVGLYRIRSEKLYADGDCEYKNFKNYFLNRGEGTFSFGYKQALRYTEIGEAFSKYKKQLEDTGYEEKFGLQKLKYLPKALKTHKNQEEQVFNKLKSETLENFIEYSSKKPGTLMSLEDSEKKTKKKHSISEDKKTIKSQKLKIEKLESAIEKKSKDKVFILADAIDSIMNKNIIPSDIPKEQWEELYKIPDLKETCIEINRKKHYPGLDKKLNKDKTETKPIDIDEQEKEDLENDFPLDQITIKDIEDIILFFKVKQKNADELFFYLLNKIDKEKKKQIMAYFNKAG